MTTLSYLDQAFPGVFIDLGGSMTELVYQAREKKTLITTPLTAFLVFTIVNGREGRV